MVNRQPFTLYEMGIKALTLQFTNGAEADVTRTLANGRASYILFQHLVANLSGLGEGSEGGSSDLVDEDGLGYEVKSYKDLELYPGDRYDMFHTAASSTFGPNNLGPKIKDLLLGGDYAAALRLCRQTGYDKNAFYVYTNTSGYEPSVPFRYFIIPTEALLATISTKDPRQVSRAALLDLCVNQSVALG